MSVSTNSAYNDCFAKLSNKVTQDLQNLLSVKNDVKNVEDVVEFTKKMVPECDRYEFEKLMKRQFYLGSSKNRVNPHKMVMASRKQTEVNSGFGPRKKKKKLTVNEKKKLGIHKINKTNKTFEMFVEVHNKWKDYATELFGRKNFVNGLWQGNIDCKMINQKVKKMEFFGCQIQVTAARCPSYVGKMGIVLDETKNTFVIISKTDQIFVLPKIDSKFSFVVNNVGISICGSNILQRPVDRAKTNLKKHSPCWIHNNLSTLCHNAEIVIC